MSFSYSGDPADSNLDAVRFYLQDTNADDPLISDEEIEYLLASWMPLYDSLYYVAAVAAETIAAKFAREVSYTADGVSISGEQLQVKYNELASSLRDLYRAEQVQAGGGPDVGGILYGEQFDPSIKPLIWAKGMHDNIRAGQQDYGGALPAAYRLSALEGGVVEE